MLGKQKKEELDNVDELRRDLEVWQILINRGLEGISTKLQGFDRGLSKQVIVSWNADNVKVNEVGILITPDLIAKAMRRSMGGLRREVLKFFEHPEVLVVKRNNYNKELLPKPWDRVAEVVSCSSPVRGASQPCMDITSNYSPFSR